MPTIDWPTMLPQQFAPDNYSEQPINDTDVFEPEQGPYIRTVTRTSNVRYDIRGVMYMNTVQWDTFKNFYNNTLNNGALSFRMRDPFIDTWRTVQFVETPRRERDDTEWAVSMRIHTT